MKCSGAMYFVALLACTGEPGPRGEKGPPGERGPAGPPGPAVLLSPYAVPVTGNLEAVAWCDEGDPADPDDDDLATGGDCVGATFAEPHEVDGVWRGWACEGPGVVTAYAFCLEVSP